MIRGLYAAASGMDVTSIQQDVVSRNLAHANQPGFRRQVLSFETFLARNAGYGSLARLHQDFTPGDPVYTERDLDVALVNDGFFVIDEDPNSPDGLLYTRNGTFHVNGDGRIVTYDGRNVLGEPGPNGEDVPIVVPPDTQQITITDDGSVHVATSTAPDIRVGRLRLATFEDNQRLERIGTTLFRAPEDMPPTLNSTDVIVRQGYRERSNGEMVSELMHMVFGLRHYEASQRALRSLSDAIELGTRPQQG